MREAITDYHTLLQDADLAAASIETLDRAQRQHALFFGEHPLSVSLRPQLLSRARFDRAVAAARGVYRALGTLEQALLASPELRAELDLAPEEEVLAMADPGCRESSPSSRLDSFFADDVGYVEYNAESPAGMAYGDELTEVFDTLPVMAAFQQRYVLRPLPVRDHQLATMLRAFREWGRSDTPVISIVDWSGLPTLTEFEMFRRFFAERGIHTCICEPGSLEYSGGVLRACDGTAVNLVYRRVLTSELLAKGPSVRALMQAYLDGAAVVVNSFRSKLLHKKMSLALLSDERYASLYSPSEQAVIRQHVPWTRKVCECATTRGGRNVPDLVAHILAHRRELVLKPNDEYGGKGVVLGWNVDDHEWEQSVHVALRQSYVVQEAIPVPREPFPIALGGEVKLLDMAIDMDPYLFGGEVGGILTRLSSSALLNVTAGAGSVVPSYVVEGAR
jgi:hypothetical protein